MSVDRPVARVIEFTSGKQVWTWCPGCDSLHPFTIESDGILNRGISWSWDGNLETPTFNPSLLCYSSVHRCEGLHEMVECTDENCPEIGHAILYRTTDGQLVQRKRHTVQPGDTQVLGHVGPHPAPYTNETAWGQCHSFLHNGIWQFLGDSDHHLANQSVPMVPLPSFWNGDSDDE